MIPPSEPDPAAENPYAAPRAALGADLDADFDPDELAKAQSLLKKTAGRASLIVVFRTSCLVAVVGLLCAIVFIAIASYSEVPDDKGFGPLPYRVLIVLAAFFGVLLALGCLGVGLGSHQPEARWAACFLACVVAILCAAGLVAWWNRRGGLNPVALVLMLVATGLAWFWASPRTAALYTEEYRAALELERRYRRAVARAVRELAHRQRSTTAKSAPRRRLF